MHASPLGVSLDFGRSRGFTLIELMIGMVLSLFIAAALGVLVSNMSRANTELDRSSRQIENGRYAIEVLSEEIKLAGFYGDVRQAGAVMSQPAACATNLAGLGWSSSPITIPMPLQGFAGTTDVPGCVTSHRNATALLALRRLSTERTLPAAMTSGDPHLQTSQCSADPFMPPLILSVDAGDFILKNLACDTINPVRRYLSRIYYIAPCSDCARGDAIPTLKRLELDGGAMQETALAQGIEDLQFEYGFDTNGDGAPDQFLTALDGVAGSAANDWSNVMAVRIWLLSRSTDPTNGYTDTKTYSLGAHGTRGPYNDAFKRRVYTTLVKLNNPAGWRE